VTEHNGAVQSRATLATASHHRPRGVGIGPHIQQDQGRVHRLDHAAIAEIDRALAVHNVPRAERPDLLDAPSNRWGIHNNRSGTNSNRIVLFRKP